MDIKEIQNKVIEFRDKRDWAQYHNPKDLAISISLEASELLEIFQWKDTGEVEALKSNEETRRKVKRENGDRPIAHSLSSIIRGNTAFWSRGT